MRKYEERAEKRKKVLVYFMTIVMVGSVFGFIFLGFSSGGITSSLEYNGFEFVNRGNFWSTNVDGKEAFFTYYPADVELVFVDISIIDRLKNKIEIDTTSDFNDTLAQQIALAQYNMGITFNNLNLFTRQGFTSPNQFNAPVITCSDATVAVPIIYFRSSNLTRVSLDGNCITVESSNQADFERIKDRLLYEMLGII
jgi:hypothetical protein